jgi:hypothetical protein
MEAAVLLRWQHQTPWIADLLTTPELTTPILEHRLHAPLSSQKLLLPEAGQLLRLTLLTTPDGRCIERAQVTMPADSPWSSTDGPLGPRLASAGFRLEKRNIRPLEALPDPKWPSLFPGTPIHLIIGRSYHLQALPPTPSTSAPPTPWPVIEWWNGLALTEQSAP